MDVTVGAVLEGKITGITKFGAFVQLGEGKTGMVHISEVANTYVNDIKEHLKEGQAVTVKVIGIDKENRINLSIKKAMAPETAPRERAASAPRRAQPYAAAQAGKQELTFEDKLKHFMQASESKMSDLNRHSDKRGGSGKRGRSR